MKKQEPATDGTKGLTLTVVIDGKPNAVNYADGSPQTSLSDLRTFLVGRQYMKSGDAFMLGSAPLGEKDDKAYTTKKIGKGEGQNWTINVFRKTANYKTPDAPEYADGPKVDPITKRDLPDEDHSKGIVPTGTATTNKRDHFLHLNPEQKVDLMSQVNIYRGFLPFPDKFWFGLTDAVQLKTKDTLPDHTPVQRDYKEHHFVSFHSDEVEANKSVTNTGSVSASGWGVTAKAEYS